MATADAEESLRQGLDALAAADWEHARSSFERAHELEPSPEALEGLTPSA